jgi:tetratricopeptide (TPR) repeat protein
MPATLLLLLALASPADDQFQSRMKGGVAALEQKDYAKAQSDFEQATRISPDNAAAWQLLARAYAQSGSAEQAIAAGKRALALEDSAEVHTLLGQVYLGKKDFASAIVECRQVLKLLPYDEDAHFRLVQVYLFQQDFNGALAALQESQKTFNRSPQLELALGVTYYGLRQFERAVDQFLKTIALAPDIPQPYAFLGRTLDHAADRLAEITARFAEYQRRNPDDYLACVLYAKALIAQLPPAGESPLEAQAYALLERALKINAEQAEAHYLMGVLLERKGDFEAARVQLERSIQLNPNDPAPHFRLARVYMKLGRKEEAEQQRSIHEKLSEQEGGALPADAK